MTEHEAGALVVAPHRFPTMDREESLASEFGRELIVTRSVEEFHAAIPKAELLLMTPFAPVTKEHIESAPRLRGILRYGVGADNIDLDAAAALGIPVTNVPASATEEVATHAVAMALSLQRRLVEGDALIRGGSWGGAFMDGVQRCSTQRAGIIGMGRIGRQVAQRFAALGFEVVGYDPYPQESSWPLIPLQELLTSSDVISLHLPLTPETKHMLGQEELAALKPGAIVVNVSRGGLIDESALAAELTRGHLGGAGLDVFEEEPIPADHPLLRSPRTILSAHVAWKSDQSLESYQDVVVQTARRLLAGQQPDFVINGVR